jgi:hypothetical protein
MCLIWGIKYLPIVLKLKYVIVYHTVGNKTKYLLILSVTFYTLTVRSVLSNYMFQPNVTSRIFCIDTLQDTAQNKSKLTKPC